MSERRPSYLWAAFNARPLGMPIPPNWFGIAAFGLLGAFLSPGFWLLGAGLEIAYLNWLARNPRFRKTVDAGVEAEDPQDQRYRSLLRQLPDAQRERQAQIESRAREILATLGSSSMMNTHADSLEQLVWLHLKLLAARQAIARVVDTAHREAGKLDAQAREIDKRLESDALAHGLRRSLEQQRDVIVQRQKAHADARTRLEHVEAELSRIDQQIALIREQVLLAADEENIGASLDALTASFNEANRWLDSQRDLIGMLNLDDNARLPRRVLQGARGTRASEGVSQ